MNQLAQEKEESNFDWFKLQNNNLENKKTNNKEVYLSFLLVFLSIQATLTMNNVFETKKNYLIHKDKVTNVLILKNDLNKSIVEKNEPKIIENYNKILTNSSIGTLNAGYLGIAILNDNNISKSTKEQIKSNFNALTYSELNKELIDFEKDVTCSIMNFSCILMQNYKIDSFLTRHMNTKKDLAVIKYNMNNNEDYKKYNYEILNNKKTDFSKKYLNDLEKFKTIEIYKKT